MIFPELCPLPKLQQQLLQQIFRDGSGTRQSLVRSTGCTLLTVSKAVTSLLQEGLLMIDGLQASAGGRRTEILKLNPNYKKTVAVDIGYGSVKLALVCMDGTLETSRVIPGRASPIQDGVDMDAVFAAVGELIELCGRERLLGISVGISGLVNYDEGKVLFCPNIAGFESRPLAEEFSERFSVPVLLDTSARCMTVGEYRYGVGRGTEDLLFLSLGTGSIASGLLMHGVPVRGVSGLAGELGHTCVRPGEKLQRCSCGRYDCLELYASMQMLCQNIAQELNAFEGYSEAKRLLNGGPLPLDRLAEIVRIGDPIVMEVFEQAKDDIVSVLAGAINLLTPSLVILGGGLPFCLPEMAGEIEKHLYAACLPPVKHCLRVEISALGKNAALMGAAAMLTEQYFGINR